MTAQPDDRSRPTMPHGDPAMTRPADEPSTAATIPAGATPATMLSGGGDLTGHVWGDFLVGPLLGRGGMGAVYRGRQRSLDRDVAIKVLPPHLSDNEGFRNRFQLEAKAVASLDSPNIIKVYGAGEAEGHHYFAMEYVEGHDLAVTVRTQGRPTQATALEWVLQAARGLQAAGELGIVHRDIKPANMMLTRRGVVKLMDFGLVRSTKDNHGLTMTGTVMGTVSYFSPEQGRGDRCDSRTDLYALGVVFYEFLTGRLPFTGEDPTSIIYQHIHVAPVPPREIDPAIPEDWQSVCLKCMQKRAEDRYQTAADLVADLERLRHGMKPDISASELARLRQGSTLYIPGRRAARGLAPWILGGTAVAISAAVAIWLTRSAETPSLAPVTVVVPPRPLVEIPPREASLALPAVTPAPPAPSAANPLRESAPTAAPPAPAPAPVAAPAPALPPVPLPVGEAVGERIRPLIDAQRFAEARTLLAQERTAHGDDPALAALAGNIDAAEGAVLVAKARDALAAGDLPGSGPLIEAATARLGRTAETIAIAQDWDGRRAHLAATLAEAKQHAAAGRRDDALAALAQAAREAPRHPSLAETRAIIDRDLARIDALVATRDEAVARGLAALAADDFDGADGAFAAALQADAGHVPAIDGKAAVARKRTEVNELAARIATAAAAEQLEPATRGVERLENIAPRHPLTAKARDVVTALRQRLDERRRTTEAAEAARAAAARKLLADAADPAVAPAELERRLAAFAADGGSGRPDYQALADAIAQRREREVIVGRLADLDRAVLGADRTTIAALVGDTEHRTALANLAGQPGLVFATTLAELRLSGDQAEATVRIRTALPTFPETVLGYRYGLHRTPSGWTVIAAKRSE